MKESKIQSYSSWMDEYGACIDKETNRVLSCGKETTKYMQDVNILPSFYKIKSRIIFRLAKLFNIDITYNSPYKYNHRGKYYSRINGKLFKNIK